MMAIYTQTDKRFHRAHLKPTRRRRVTARNRMLMRAVTLLFVLGASAYALTDLAYSTPALRVSTINVEGNSRLSRGEVLGLVGSLHGQNILLADLEVARAKLLTSGWVSSATLRRVLPSTIEVVVAERKPVGLGRFGDRLYLVDDVGTIIDEYGPRFSSFDLPIIDGLSAENSSRLVNVDPARAALAARLIIDVASQQELAARISQVNVRDPYNAIVLLSGDPAPIYLGNERFVERLVSYLELTPALRARVPDIEYVDLRFDQRVYVRPAGHSDGRTHQTQLAIRGREGVANVQ